MTRTQSDWLLILLLTLVPFTCARGHDGATYTVESDPYTRVTAHGGDEWSRCPHPRANKR